MHSISIATLLHSDPEACYVLVKDNRVAEATKGLEDAFSKARDRQHDNHASELTIDLPGQHSVRLTAFNLASQETLWLGKKQCGQREKASGGLARERFSAQGEDTQALSRLDDTQHNRYLTSLLASKTQALRDSEASLRNAEALFTSVLALSPAGIWTCNSDRKVVFANKAWREITGIFDEQDWEIWFSQIHPDDQALAQKTFEDYFAEEPVFKHVTVRFKRRPPETGWRWVGSAASSCLDLSGTNRNWVTGAMYDVTDTKRVAELEQSRAQEIIEAQKAKESFLNNIQHEIKNPISAISMAIESAFEHLHQITSHTTADTFAAVEDDLQIIKHCEQHITRLVADTLLLSTLENNRLKVTRVPIFVQDVFQSVYEMLKQDIAQKGIDYSINFVEGFHFEDTHLMLDPARLSQILINLLSNSIKFLSTCDQRRLTLHVSLSQTEPSVKGVVSTVSPATLGLRVEEASELEDVSDADPAYLLVSVTDSGPGMSQCEMKRLFHRFSQGNAKTHITYSGTGLGLFISSGLISLMQGQIGVESIKDEGTTFTFYIKTAVSKASAHRDQITVSETDTLDDLAKSLKILLVEDNLVNQKLLAQLLRKKGCEVLCANNGLECLDILKGSSYMREEGFFLDVCLLDVEMPVMNGIDTIKRIRQMERDGQVSGHLPVIAVSANSSKTQLQEFSEIGFDSIVPKPFKVDAILSGIGAVLEKRSDS